MREVSEMAASHTGSELIPPQFYSGLSDDIEEGPPLVQVSLCLFSLFSLCKQQPRAYSLPKLQGLART